jgi:hypothetical protein
MKSTKPTLTASFFLISAILVLVSIHSSAQEKFNLSDYKNPDYRWQKFDLSFGLGGNNSFNRTEFEGDSSGTKKINSQFNNNLAAGYYNTKNSASYQGFQEISIGSSLATNRVDFENLDLSEQDYSSKTRQGRIDLDVTTNNRFYNRKKMFIEADLELATGYRRQVMDNSDEQETYPYYYKSDYYQFNLETGIPLLVGIGRIEEVQDARLAVYILDDLVASGDIKKTPTHDEILAFSEFITQTKNKRYFDARLKKIAEITAIDSFLTVRGLKAESDASYYTLINDNWDFASGPIRSAGGRFSLGIAPAIDYVYIENENLIRDTLAGSSVIESYSNFGKSKTNAWSLDFMTGYTWEKPTSLYWQHTFNTELAYSLYNQTYKYKNYTHDTLNFETETTIDSPNLQVNISYFIGYYPNSRTQITLSASTAYQQYWGQQISKDDNENENKIDTGNILVDNSLQLSCYYYLSPQLRLTVSIGSYYNFSKQNQGQPEDVEGDESEHNLHNSIYAALVYSIF